MVGRGKYKKPLSKGLSQRRKQYRISQLPDPLICHILSCLPTKEAVKTSVLSTRWRSLWLWVPGLDLASWEFPDFSAFKSFGDRFFDSNRVSCLHKLILDFDGDKDDASYLMSWIDDAVRRKIQHLHVRCSTNDYFCEIPISILTCETLVFLRLEWVALPDAEFFYLPCLTTMHLRYVLYPNDEGTFERLVSSCPVLEELEIDECSNDDAIVFRVLSRSLKKLTIDLLSPLDGLATEVVIDAPKLRFLNIRDNVSESFVITSIGSNANLCIDLTFGLEDFDEASVLLRRSSIRGFLFGISKVRDMTIRPDTFQLLCIYSKLEPLPQFGYMSRLRVTLRVSDLKWLPNFLESCPKLKSLILINDTDSER